MEQQPVTHANNRKRKPLCDVALNVVVKKRTRNKKSERLRAAENVRCAQLWKYDLRRSGGTQPGFLKFEPDDIEYMLRDYDELVECQDDVEEFLNVYPVAENMHQYWCFIARMLPDKRHEACLENEELRKSLFQKMYAQAVAENNQNFLNAGYDHNSMKTCSRTGFRCYICSSFGFHNATYDGLQPVSKTCTLITKLILEAKKRSKTRATKKGLPRKFEISMEWLFETLVRLRFRCKLSGERLHATARWEGSLTIDRLDNDEDYTIQNSRIIVNSLQAANGYVMTLKFLNAYLNPNLGLQESLDTVGFTSEELRTSDGCLLNYTLYEDEFDLIEQKWYRFCNCTRDCNQRLKLNSQNFEPRAASARNKGFRFASRVCRKARRTYYSRLGDKIANINCRDKDEKFKGTNIEVEPITRKEVIDVYVRQGGRCVKSKLPLRLDESIKGVENSTAQNLSIDAIDPTKPHKNNFQLVCAIYNVQNQGRGNKDM